jgi:hypothetical protein
MDLTTSHAASFRFRFHLLQYLHEHGHLLVYITHFALDLVLDLYISITSRASFPATALLSAICHLCYLLATST